MVGLRPLPAEKPGNGPAGRDHAHHSASPPRRAPPDGPEPPALRHPNSSGALHRRRGIIRRRLGLGRRLVLEVLRRAPSVTPLPAALSRVNPPRVSVQRPLALPLPSPRRRLRAPRPLPSSP